jgi:hypothetical protein
MAGEATDFRRVMYSQGLLKSEKVTAKETEEGVFQFKLALIICMFTFLILT